MAAQLKWKGIRCKYCGAFLADGQTIKNTNGKIVAKGKCPIAKRDCGRL